MESGNHGELNGSRAVPGTVHDGVATALYTRCNDLRAEIKRVATAADALRKDAKPQPGVDAEVIANTTLAFRHLEDASMRIGKALQALDGGVSVYDRATTVGA